MLTFKVEIRSLILRYSIVWYSVVRCVNIGLSAYYTGLAFSKWPMHDVAKSFKVKDKWMDFNLRIWKVN